MSLGVVEFCIAESRNRAQAFLLQGQDPAGSWRDFLLPAGLSDAWITGYVGAALADAGQDQVALDAARRGWAFLAQTELSTGGWSYNPSVPGDADSTLWGLRMAAALGCETDPLARRGAEFLAQHLQPDGGLSTYASADPIRGYIGAPPMVSFDGWTQSHVCVSAAGAGLLDLQKTVLPYLLNQQAPDGSWPVYFWFDREYATGAIATALSQAGPEGSGSSNRHKTALAQARVWLVERIAQLSQVRGSGTRTPAFAMACAATGLAASSDGKAATLSALRTAGQCLSRWQRDTGAWGPTARLRVPMPMQLVPDETATWSMWKGLPKGSNSFADILKATFTNYSPDHRGMFTAATALSALAAIERAVP